MKLLYKPLGLLVSVLGGIIAASLFKQLWRLVARESEAPAAKDQDRTWREVIIAAAIQGAVFGGVKALIDRAGATGGDAGGGASSVGSDAARAGRSVVCC